MGLKLPVITPDFTKNAPPSKRPALSDHPIFSTDPVPTCRTFVPGKGRCSFPEGHGPDHDVVEEQ